MGRTILNVLFIFTLILPAHAVAQEPVEITLDVRVEGVEKDLQQNVLLTLGIEKRKGHPYLTPAMIRKLHRAAPSQIRSALEPYGYYNPDIEATLETEGQQWTAIYRIDPGEPVHVRRLSFKVTGPGEGRPETIVAVKQLVLKEGDVFVHGIYEESKRLMLNALRQEGYLDARFPVREVEVDPDGGTADITLELETGPRFFFGSVEFKQDFLSEKYLRGLVTIEKGQPYTLAALLDIEQALTDSRLFQRVDVRAAREDARGLEVPVQVQLTPGPSQKYSVGVGYGTDTGARGRVGWEHRRVNKKVHRIKSDLVVSQANQEFTTKYIVPLKRPRTDHLDYSLGWSRERVEDIDSETYLVGTSLSRLRGKIQETWFLNFEQENYTISNETQTSILLIPGVNWTLVVADDRIRTSRGYKGILELKGASKDLISDTSFAQASLNLKGILSVSEDFRFLARTDLGTTWVDQFSELPSSQRFFAGGTRSVRGYAYKSLGPEDSAGDVVGGRHLVVGSLEMEYFLFRNWSAAAFFDIGNSFNELSEPLEQGTGVGIRWHTLIGPIQLDFASAITQEGKPWRIHLDIGPDL